MLTNGYFHLIIEIKMIDSYVWKLLFSFYHSAETNKILCLIECLQPVFHCQYQTYLLSSFISENSLYSIIK